MQNQGARWNIIWGLNCADQGCCLRNLNPKRIASIPECDEDCASAALETLAACMVSLIGLFGTSAFIMSSDKFPAIRRSLAAATVLIAVFLIPALSHYLYHSFTQELLLHVTGAGRHDLYQAAAVPEAHSFTAPPYRFSAESPK